MVCTADHFGPWLLEVLSFVNSPSRVGYLVGELTWSSRGGSHWFIIVFFGIRIFFFGLGFPDECGTVTADSIYLAPEMSVKLMQISGYVIPFCSQSRNKPPRRRRDDPQKF